MTKRKTTSGGAIECPACGEEFANGLDLAEHQAEAGPVCPTCDEHVDATEWNRLVGRVAAINEADEGEDEEEEGK